YQRAHPPHMSPYSLLTHPAPPAPYPLSLHDALPISPDLRREHGEHGQLVNHLRDGVAADDVRAFLAVRAKPGYRVEALRVGHKRSEEHTSELQSRRDLVCRLLLEKKNTTL